MNFILLVGLICLYLKYRDVSQELLNINVNLERIDNEIDLLNCGGEDNANIK